MIKVNVKKQSNYPVGTLKIKKHLAKFLKDKGIVSEAEVSLALVGKEKMISLARQYMGEVSTIPHNVLSFTADESKGKFVYPPDGTLYLGDIIVCYPKALEEAKREDKLIEEKGLELIEHGASHLLGEKHE